MDLGEGGGVGASEHGVTRRIMHGMLQTPMVPDVDPTFAHWLELQPGGTCVRVQ